MSHNAFTWQCFGNIFISGNLSDYSYNINRKVKQIIGKYTINERKLFVDTFFRILKTAGYTGKSELNKLSLSKINNLIKETKNLTSEEKRILLDFLIIFLKKEKID